jgi:hypothetical protein
MSAALWVVRLCLGCVCVAAIGNHRSAFFTPGNGLLLGRPCVRSLADAIWIHRAPALGSRQWIPALRIAHYAIITEIAVLEFVYINAARRLLTLVVSCCCTCCSAFPPGCWCAHADAASLATLHASPLDQRTPQAMQDAATAATAASCTDTGVGKLTWVLL